jgi:signal transduction histidine kinase
MMNPADLEIEVTLILHLSNLFIRRSVESTSPNEDLGERERREQLQSFFKVIVFYFGCPAMFIMAATDSAYDASSVKLMFLVRSLCTGMMAILGLVTIKQKTLFKAQLWATVTAVVVYSGVHYMFYYRGNADSHFLYGLLPAMIIISTGMRLTNAFYFLNSAMIILPTIVIGIGLSHGNPSPMFIVNMINWLLVFAFCTSSRWFFEKIYAQERNLRLALKAETQQREILLSQAINDLISGDQVSGILEEKVPMLVKQWGDLTRKLNEHKQREAEIIATRRFAEQARQVAHDIRSPLSALEMALVNSEISEDRKEIFKAVSARIRRVVEDLLSRSRNSINVFSEAKNPELGKVDLVKVIDEIVLENRVASNSIHSNIACSSLAIQANEADLGRMLSNLLDNSLESKMMNRDLLVQLEIQESRDEVLLLIQDNGKGMSPEVLSRVGENGFTFGKDKGNGLGVSFAKRKLKEWGGSLKILSKEGEGTVVALTFKKV